MAGGLRWRRSPRAPPPGVSHGAVGPPTRGSLPSPIRAGNHGARPTSRQVWAGLQKMLQAALHLASAAPKPQKNHPRFKKKNKALTKPLHPCTAAQTPSSSPQVLPEAPKSFQHLPSSSKPCSAPSQGFYKEPLPLGSFGPLPLIYPSLHLLTGRRDSGLGLSFVKMVLKETPNPGRCRAVFGGLLHPVGHWSNPGLAVGLHPLFSSPRSPDSRCLCPKGAQGHSGYSSALAPRQIAGSPPWRGAGGGRKLPALNFPLQLPDTCPGHADTKIALRYTTGRCDALPSPLGNRNCLQPS